MGSKEEVKHPNYSKSNWDVSGRKEMKMLGTKKKVRTHAYLGVRTKIVEGRVFGTERVVFRASTALSPYFEEVIGPFRTVRGAKAMCHYTWLNPCNEAIGLAEKVGKDCEEELRGLGKRTCR